MNIEVDSEGDIASISISDNGVGFTPENLTSFETSDSRFKYQRGGKGVGRFIWIKMFETIRVESVYKKGPSIERISFRFVPEKENSIVNKQITSVPGAPLETKINLSDLRPEQRGRVRPTSYLKDLALHFFPQFIAGTLPQIDITYRGTTSSLNEFIAEQVEAPVRAVVPVDFGEGKTEITVDHLFVDASISTGLRNSYLLTAHGRLKYEDDDKQTYRYERVIHELICPMGEMYRSGDYVGHNLWLIDDALATYQFFASDKQIRSLAPGAKSTKEPDLVFVNPLGFRREGTTDPIVIVEFKRPGDDRLSQDPINQVLQYIDDLRGSKVRDVDGAVVSEIGDQTPFECIIVCDLTASARRLFERSIAQNPRPDGEGYYGWSSAHKAYIRVISYRKMLRDAEIRNKTFFDQLKLESPSAAAKKRSAKVRERRRADANGSWEENREENVVEG